MTKCVPENKVLIYISKDWFTNEIFHIIYNAGEEANREGKLLKNGESIVVRDIDRNADYSYTVTELKITNKNGKALIKKINSE